MDFTDHTYYTADIDIPFENKDTTVFTRDYITPSEEKILIDCLGAKLYSEFITGLSVLPTPDQKWLDLRDGVEFDIEFSGKTYPIRWNGLINAEKKSLLSYFTYSEWLSRNYTQLLGTGVAIADKKNAKTVDVREKILTAKDRAELLIGKYPIVSDEFQGIIFPDDINVDLVKVFEPTLFNFLYHKKSDYESWIFKPYKKGNFWDI